MDEARRRLTESQRAMIAAGLATHRKGRPENASNDAFKQEDAGKLLNVGRASVQRARKVLESGDAELIRQVESGEVGVSREVF